MATVEPPQMERKSESDKSQDTAFSSSAISDVEKPKVISSTGDPVYEPAAPIEEIKPIISEFIGVAAGLSTVLLQVAHPVVGRGVGIHSEFSVPGRAMDRAEKTGIYVYVMVFGEPHEKEAMRNYVNKMHARVKGGEGSTAYYAKDPKGLSLFFIVLAPTNLVDTTMYADIIRNYERAFGPIQPPEKAERVYKEFSYLGTSLSMPPELWPKDRAAFWEYYNDMVENNLEVTPEARKVLYDLFHPWRAAPAHLKLVFYLLMPLLRAVTIEAFPPKVREDYGLKSTIMTRLLNKSFTKPLFAIYPSLPLSVRHSDKNRYMALMKKMMERQGIQEFKHPGK